MRHPRRSLPAGMLGRAPRGPRAAAILPPAWTLAACAAACCFASGRAAACAGGPATPPAAVACPADGDGAAAASIPLRPAPMEQALASVRAMEKAWAGVEDCTWILEKRERLVDGTTTHETARMKFCRPDRYYMGILDGPNEGSELLYPKPGTTGLAVAHAGGLTGLAAGILAHVPGMAASVPSTFTPEDPRVIRGQHHSILDSDPGSIIALVARNLGLAAERGKGEVRFLEPGAIEDHPCLRLEIRLPGDEGVPDVMRAGETLRDLARRHGQDPYVILYANPGLGDGSRLRAGDRVFVPRYYGARAVLWICDTLALPRRIDVFDREERLYESYTHREIRTNTGLTDRDFSPDNDAYSF